MNSLALALTAPAAAAPSSNGARLVAIDGRTLPLKSAALVADARGGIVRIELTQVFVNPFADPLRVSYSLPLPSDGVVSGFEFQIGAERIVGEVDARKKARERFENAILEGRTAAILDQERTSLFTQEVGNIPPQSEVTCRVFVDQKLTWLADGYWEWRFPTVVAPRYLGATGRVADAAKVTVDVADQAMPIRLSLSLSVFDKLPNGALPESPSHAIHAAAAVGRTDVTFGGESGVSLDRDVVVRWKVAAMNVGASIECARTASGAVSDGAYGLITMVPPSPESNFVPVPRDLIVLLDTSGSMGGQPLDQARKVTAALLDSLNEHDTIELIEFSNEPRRWKNGAVSASKANVTEAHRWLAALRASGGTEMHRGIIEALAPLRNEGQRQIILITDGQIGFEHEVLSAISERLPAGSRVHTVGIGSGVNRSLTEPAARAGRGVEVVLGLDEDPERGAKRLLERTVKPCVTNVTIQGTAVENTATTRLPDLYGGAPALFPVKLHANGGTVTVRGLSASGAYSETFTVAPVALGEGNQAIVKLFARETVEDLELLKRCNRMTTVDSVIETLGVNYQIATRLTSWVAISSKQMVDPTAKRQTIEQPHELPYGMSAEGVGCVLRG